ncbi:MAG: glycosyltransferase family 4 protein, partial [Microcystaceae cyanobacterium]
IPLRFPRLTSALTLYFRVALPTILKQAQHLLCNSQATADDLVTMLGVPANKITPILLGYNQQYFRHLEKPASPPEKPYFLYLGRHDPHKNLSRLISAFAQLSQPQNYELWLAGPSDRRFTPKLMAQAKELGIESQIKCLDYVPFEQLPMIINQALAMVFPSLWEGFGFPVLEAMACGTPVITSNLSSLPEVAENAALLVDPYSIADISLAMQKITTDSLLRSQLSHRGLERAKILTWEKTGLETLGVLKQFL